MNTITIELCTEDRARLDAILAALQKASPRCDNCVKLVNDLCNAKDSAPEAPQEPTEEEPTNTQPEPEKPTEAKPENESPAPEVTVEDIRSKVLQLTGAGKKDEVRAIVKEYAEKVGDIPADKRAEVLEKLTALEG